MSTFTVSLDVEFSDEDVITNIFLSGAFSWGWWQSVDYDTPDGGIVVRVDDPEGDESVNHLPYVEKVILFDDIRRVMGNICADAYPNPEYYALAKKQIMDGIRTGDFDFDACGADEIIQIAMFGKVVFA